MRKRISIPMIITLALAFVLSIILRSANLVIIVTSLEISYKLFYPSISKTVFDSKLFAVILIFFSYIILLECTVVASWLINNNFPLSGAPALLLLIISAMYSYNYFLHRKEPKTNDATVANRKTINIQDILSLLVALTIVGIITLPPLSLKPEYKKATSTMSLISGNVDDTGHLSLVNDNLQFDRGILIKSDAVGNTRNSGFYPAGWSSASAILIKMFYPNIKTGGDSLVAYAIQKLFWFFILLYLLTRVSFTMFGFLSDKSPKKSSLLWVSASSLVFGYTLLLPIFKEGFYSFLPQLIAVLLAIPVIIQLGLEKKTHASFRSLPLLFIVCVGGCLAWLLPLPAFLLTILIILGMLVVNHRFRITINNIFGIIKDNLILLMLLTMAIATQTLVMASDHGVGSVSFISGLLMGGGITTYNEFFYVFILFGFLASLLLASNKARKNIDLILSLIVSLSLFCFFIYVIQIWKIGQNEYYYYKTLDILTLSAIPFCITGFGLIINKIAEGGRNIILTIIISLIILTTAIQLIGLDTPTLSFARGYRAFSSQIDNSLINELKTHISQDKYFNKNYSFYYVPDTNFYFQNEVANMMAKSNEQDSNCFSSIRHTIWKTPAISVLLTEIAQKCDGYKIDIVTNSNNSTNFEEAVNSMGLNSSVTIKSY